MLLAFPSLRPSRADLMHLSTVVRSDDAVYSCCTRVFRCVRGATNELPVNKNKKVRKRQRETGIDSCCAFQWPVHVEIPLAVAHRRSRETLHGLVQPCTRWDITPLAHHRHDLDLVLPPESNVWSISKGSLAIWACQAWLYVRPKRSLGPPIYQPGRTGRLDASKYEAGR